VSTVDVLADVILGLLALVYVGGLAGGLVVVVSTLQQHRPIRRGAAPAIFVLVLQVILWPAAWGWERAEQVMSR
jgi:hypothetical protein